MQIQIWRTEAIENILWAVYTAMGAAATNFKADDRSPEHHRGFKCGFKAGLQYVINSFKEKPLNIKTWNPKHIQNILASAQIETHMIMATNTQPIYSRGFEQGLDAALQCVATSFGLDMLTLNGTLLKNGPLATNNALFRKDIENILLAIEATTTAIGSIPKTEDKPAEYHKGFEDALILMALSFNTRPLFGPRNFIGTKDDFPFWLRKDIKKKLTIAYKHKSSISNQAQDTGYPLAYKLGFETALKCLATSFGITLMSWF